MPCRGTGVGDVREPGPRALDPRGLGARGFSSSRLGARRHRVRQGQRVRPRPHRGHRWDGSSAGIGSFEGAEAIRSFLEEWMASFEEYEYNQKESHDLRNGVVFVVATFGGRPAGSSGGMMREQVSYAVTWKDGLIARVV